MHNAIISIWKCIGENEIYVVLFTGNLFFYLCFCNLKKFFRMIWYLYNVLVFGNSTSLICLPVFANQAQKIERDLERELDALVQLRRNLEIHILRTQNWCENQGSWRVAVYEAEVSVEHWWCGVRCGGYIVWNESIIVWNISLQSLCNHPCSCIKHALKKKHQVMIFYETIKILKHITGIQTF